MRFFRDMSVRAKLFGGFGAVLFVAVIVGVVLMSQMGNVNSGGVYLGTNALPSVAGIGIVDASAGDYRRNQLRYVIETDKAQMQQAVAGWKAADAKDREGAHGLSDGVYERDRQAGVGVGQEPVGRLQGQDGEHPDRRCQWRQRPVSGCGPHQPGPV